MLGQYQDLLWPGPHSLFDPWESYCACVIGEVSLTQGVTEVVIFSFSSSRAQLLPLTFSLKCQRETGPNLLGLTSLSYSQPRGPLYLLPHFFSSFLSSFLFSFFLCQAHSMWKFLGQRQNLSHSSDPSHCSDNTRSLTHCAKRDLLVPCFLVSG